MRVEIRVQAWCQSARVSKSKVGFAVKLTSVQIPALLIMCCAVLGKLHLSLGILGRVGSRMSSSPQITKSEGA